MTYKDLVSGVTLDLKIVKVWKHARSILLLLRDYALMFASYMPHMLRWKDASAFGEHRETLQNSLQLRQQGSFFEDFPR